MRHQIIVGMLLGFLIPGTVIQTGNALKFEPTLASDSVGPIGREVETDPALKTIQKHSPTLEAPDDNVIPPNLPPPAIDPEIVHEPPPISHPEAVIPPPKIDPEMAVPPQTLPGYPDNLNGKSENMDPEDKSKKKR